MITIALVSAVATGLTTASATPAAADTLTTVHIAGPTSITIGTKEIKKYTVTGSVDTFAPTQTDVSWTLSGKALCVYDFGDATPAGNGAFQDGSYIDPGLIDSNDCAGAAVLEVSAFDDSDGGGIDSEKQSVQLLRAARWSVVNAHPEPIHKGSTVTIDGTLQRASWADHRYHDYSKQAAQLQFRPTGGAYATVKTVNSATGKFRAAAKQTVSGCWRYVFAGSSTTSAATGTGDCVTVR